MSESTKVMSRPLPSLAQWLGDGARSEDFEAYVRDMLAAEYLVTDPREQMMVRAMRTLTIACMEVCRTEVEGNGHSFGEVLPLLARACGVAIMAPILSATREDSHPPMRGLVDLVQREFKFGAMRMVLAQERRGEAAS